jgi:hypothetical protein
MSIPQQKHIGELIPAVVTELLEYESRVCRAASLVNERKKTDNNKWSNFGKYVILGLPHYFPGLLY